HTKTLGLLASRSISRKCSPGHMGINSKGLRPLWAQSLNWLQVSASTKLPEIDEREGNKFEPKMTNVFGLKAQQQTLEFILPGEGAFHDEAQFVQCGIEEALAPPFGRLPVARILFEVRLEPNLE